MGIPASATIWKKEQTEKMMSYQQGKVTMTPERTIVVKKTRYNLRIELGASMEDLGKQASRLPREYRLFDWESNESFVTLFFEAQSVDEA